MGELLGSHVVDVAGRRVGTVHDVRLVQDGPDRGRFGASLRVDGLVVGQGAVAIRLGYHRAGVRGPWLLARVFGALERRARYVSWDQVAERTPSHLRLSCSADRLPRVSELG